MSCLCHEAFTQHRSQVNSHGMLPQMLTSAVRQSVVKYVAIGVVGLARVSQDADRR